MEPYIGTFYSLVMFMIERQVSLRSYWLLCMSCRFLMGRRMWWLGSLHWRKDLRWGVTTVCWRRGGGIFLEKYLEGSGPAKGGIFMRCVALERILTADNLIKRGVVVVEWRYMCKNHGENVNHLLLHSSVAWELWSMILCVWCFLGNAAFCFWLAVFLVGLVR